MEATASILSHLPSLHSKSPSFLSLSLSKFPHFHKPHSSSSSSSPLRLRISIPTLLHFPFKTPIQLSTKSPFELHSSVEEVAVLETPDEIEDGNQKRKVIVANLPFALSADDLKKTFSECGTVKDVEIIKSNNGRNRGYAFITMSSGSEAQALIDKFHEKELSGRTIRVEFSKRLKKPRPQPAAAAPVETRHKLYISNLQWKARSNNLREFFSADFNPVSARVVFESASGRSAGYGFVSFSTREEAEAAISSLDGKELLGRPVRIKFSDKNTEDKVDGEEVKDSLIESVDGPGEDIESVDGPGEEEILEGQPEKS